MLSTSVPNNCTFSPASATPHLTINHDVAADLDSTNAFEGPEKLLEVWFAPSPTTLPPSAPVNGLKAVPADTWVPMLDMVNCKVLSVLESDNMDAYLLSESSMFVFPHKIILKTCGTTTLLLGLQRMLHIAAKHGFPYHNANSADDIQAAATPYRVFYSRKNFLFPEKQQGPHRSWKQEVKYLDDMFDGGSAYMVGKMNGDHWYLYLTSPNQQALTPPRTPESELEIEGAKIPVGTSFNTVPGSYHDETLEILMTDLDPENAKQFYLSHASAVASDKMAAEAKEARKEAINSLGGLSEDIDEVDVFCNEDPDSNMLDSVEALTTEGHALGTVVSESCGLSSVYPTSKYPDARVDAYLFSPCGFSANGVVPPPSGGKGEHYFTVHVTPEPHCSFASFETNVPGGQSGRTTTEIIEHVVEIFKPGRFSVTLFEAKAAAHNPYCMGDDEPNNWAAKRLVDPVRGYRRVDRIVHDFEDYDLVFRFYEREGWAGTKSARVGEPVSPTNFAKATTQTSQSVNQSHHNRRNASYVHSRRSGKPPLHPQEGCPRTSHKVRSPCAILSRRQVVAPARYPQAKIRASLDSAEGINLRDQNYRTTEKYSTDGVTVSGHGRLDKCSKSTFLPSVSSWNLRYVLLPRESFHRRQTDALLEYQEDNLDP